ncbi:hypothetical protein [Rufibacter latericius]|uniref:Uncharacterized protein n=1 Tax=Rufibacter latericius TaxID=2487040 RepID=A0A3M9MM43_9BACT|nr:hypothetical protein [Rufibacter latericius]RNI26610.1 hypothetical protein EFB08_11365 [Rufibacter latericius]
MRKRSYYDIFKMNFAAALHVNGMEYPQIEAILDSFDREMQINEPAITITMLATTKIEGDN